MNIILISPIDTGAVSALEARHSVTRAFDFFASSRDHHMRYQNVLILRSGGQVTREILEQAPELALIIRAGSGFDNIDIAYAKSRGMRVLRIPGPSAASVAEYTFGLMLSLCRNIVRADALVRDGLWPKPQLGGSLLSGKVLGVVGTGNIGSRVGELGIACDMGVLGCVRPAHGPWSPPAGIEATDIATILRRADFVTLHTPLTDKTRHLIGAPELAEMKASAYLINTARGGVVDEEALYEALASGRLAGAALDVHEREGEGVIPKLADLPNVVLTPHIGGSAHESQRDIGRRLVELVDAYANGNLDEEASESELLA